ncbi:MAG: LytTR family DNA-binding domain-containing protein [Candidatus Bathyarchaeia archaeon]
MIYLLSHYPFCRVISECDSAQQAICICEKLRPEVIFLDIELPDMSGLETAKIILNFNNPPLIVFATAYDEYAVEAFELGAVDYILKPFEEKRIEKTVKRILNLKSNREEWEKAINKISEFLSTSIMKKLPVHQTNGVINLIPYKDIIFGEAFGKRVKIFTNKEEYFFEGTLTELEVRLKVEGFLRVHKSYIVNLRKIEAVIPWFKGTYWLVMEGIKVKIPVSKSLIREVKEIFGIKYS